MLPAPSNGKSEFFYCMNDSPDYIATVHTSDPQSATTKAPPAYTGMQHPPPCTGVTDSYVDPGGAQVCDIAWQAPFLPGYTPPAGSGQEGSLKLSMCNWSVWG